MYRLGLDSDHEAELTINITIAGVRYVCQYLCWQRIFCINMFLLRAEDLEAEHIITVTNSVGERNYTLRFVIQG